jgi:hypothetical protein
LGIPTSVTDVLQTLDSDPVVHNEVDPITGLEVNRTTHPLTAFALVTSYSLDLFGNRNATALNGTDFEARSTAAQYDDRGVYVWRQTDAMGHATVVEHDLGFGAVIRPADLNGHVTATALDRMGRPEVRTNPDNTTVRSNWTWCQQVRRLAAWLCACSGARSRALPARVPPRASRSHSRR